MKSRLSLVDRGGSGGRYAWRSPGKVTRFSLITTKTSKQPRKRENTLAKTLADKPEMAVYMTKTQLRGYARRASLGDATEADADLIHVAMRSESSSVHQGEAVRFSRAREEGFLPEKSRRGGLCADCCSDPGAALRSS